MLLSDINLEASSLRRHYSLTDEGMALPVKSGYWKAEIIPAADVPEQQLHRWKDDGGALPPKATNATS